MGVKLKVHNVFHNADDFKASYIEEQMMRMCMDNRVEDVRLAKGNENSPLFIILSDDMNKISFKEAKTLARSLLREFDKRVSGVKVDTAINDRNIRIEN